MRQSTVLQSLEAEGMHNPTFRSCLTTLLLPQALKAWWGLDGEWKGSGLASKQSTVVAIWFSTRSAMCLPSALQWGTPHPPRIQVPGAPGTEFAIPLAVAHQPYVGTMVLWEVDMPNWTSLLPTRAQPLGPVACGEEGKEAQEPISVTPHSVVRQGPWASEGPFLS